MNNKLTYKQWLALCKLGDFASHSDKVTYTIYDIYKHIIFRLINVPITVTKMGAFRTEHGADWWNNITVHNMWGNGMIYSDEDAKVFNEVRKLYLLYKNK